MLIAFKKTYMYMLLSNDEEQVFLQFSCDPYDNDPFDNAPYMTTYPCDYNLLTITIINYKIRLKP